MAFIGQAVGKNKIHAQRFKGIFSGDSLRL